jgi:hypothetical protein
LGGGSPCPSSMGDAIYQLAALTVGARLAIADG